MSEGPARPPLTGLVSGTLGMGSGQQSGGPQRDPPSWLRGMCPSVPVLLTLLWGVTPTKNLSEYLTLQGH